MRQGQSFTELVELMQTLLAPGGCPWDREQTLDSLRPYLLEETYEVLEALETGNADDHREELGDLLLQIVFQAALRHRDGDFDIDQVIRGIVDKMVSRHPHVFGDASAEDADAVVTRWNEIKAEEKKDRRTLDGIPQAMPALARATRLTERAGHVGFDWPTWQGAREKLTEELAEFDAAVARDPASAQTQSELGDTLLALVNVARKLGHDPETCLRQATRRFQDRFEHVENSLDAQGRKPAEASLDELETLWQAAKRDLGPQITENTSVSESPRE